MNQEWTQDNEKIIEYFRGLLLDTSSSLDLFQKIFSKVKGIEYVDENIKVKLVNDVSIELTGPADKKEIEQWPESVKRIFSEHATMGIWKGENVFGGQIAFDNRINVKNLEGTQWKDEDYDLNSIQSPISGGDGSFVFHPAFKDMNGEVLCQVIDGKINGPLALGPGSIFLWMIAGYMEIDRDISLPLISKDKLISIAPKSTKSGVIKLIMEKSGLSKERIDDLIKKLENLYDLQKSFKKANDKNQFIKLELKYLDDIEAYKNALPESLQFDFTMIHGYNINCYKNELDELLKRYK
ncbi:hypothetical protein [Leptospira interrogans]|uniref:Uncharacterized protein n=2 Tax=Leptospira interrogans TaxID=173 RepID=A0A0E2DAK7_LEPIR|nr:hypothetical protein [Leptospira interrogans]EMM81107.1 hypothetical protein LEP1GSC037_1085 [Leptospira interrogans str. 2006001854]EKR57145.1 hypothetical protein LEP1GSC105_4037 [Leptospira interrogans str. UI 12758]EKR85092.1 hypothetical protein LEP1GSC099_1506 [Leptospira interrogans str. UI 08452]EMN35829.1 hypothetical protein LEP1GSC084_1680 [Leptospira interrogans serovar Medanensis str. L0448]EMN41422.1 hypothetical protein LEP1GSC085_0226 [Leptospira interrogans str. L0996]